MHIKILAAIAIAFQLLAFHPIPVNHIDLPAEESPHNPAHHAAVVMAAPPRRIHRIQERRRSPRARRITPRKIARVTRFDSPYCC